MSVARPLKSKYVDAPPSKVVHIRGLPPYTTESDIHGFVQQFLPQQFVSKVVLAPNQQAFVQTESIEHAMALMSQTGGAGLIKQKGVQLQFSTRAELMPPPQQPDYKNSTQDQAQPNSILIVTVLNTKVPVTLDHIHQIFKPYGEILKIIIFHKNGVFKALVELNSIEAAMNAKVLLEGKDIFLGCCHLRIGFSTLSEIQVKQRSATARDFTVKEQYEQQAHQYNQPHPHPPPQTQHQPPHHQPYANYQNNAYPYYDPAYAQQSAYPSGCVIIVSNLPPVNCDTLFTLFGVYGDVLRVKILYNKRDTALIQFAQAQQAYLAALHLNHLSLYGKTLSVAPSKHVEVSMPKSNTDPSSADQQQTGLTQDYSHSPIHRFRGQPGTGKKIHPPSCVLHVSSLADSVTENDILHLFMGGVKSLDDEKSLINTQPPVVQFFSAISTSKPGPPNKQAFVKFDSISLAAENLIAFHNYNMNGRYLRISFSGKDPNAVVNSAGQ